MGKLTNAKHDLAEVRTHCAIASRVCAASLRTTSGLVDGPMLAQIMMDAGIGVSGAEAIRVLKPVEDGFDGL